jgi:hypothetical protein
VLLGRLQQLGAIVEPLHQVQAVHAGTGDQLSELLTLDTLLTAVQSSRDALYLAAVVS